MEVRNSKIRVVEGFFVFMHFLEIYVFPIPIWRILVRSSKMHWYFGTA